jgi:hypothetical protein
MFRFIGYGHLGCNPVQWGIYRFRLQSRRGSQARNQQTQAQVELTLLKMEYICPFETSGCLRTTWSYSPQYRILHSHWRKNLTPKMFRLSIKYSLLHRLICILWRICPLLGNGSVNTFPKHMLSTIEGHPLLGNGPIKSIFDNKRPCFPWGPCRGVVSSTEQSWRSELRKHNGVGEEFIWKSE